MTRRTGLIAGAVAAVIVVAVAFVVVLGSAILNATEKPPVVSAFGDGRAVEVEPFRYCPVQTPLCDYDGTTASVPLRPGFPLQLSLPTSISGAPWGLATVYADDQGTIVEADEYFGPGTRNSMTIPQTNDAGMALIGVEVRLPSGVIDVDTDQEEIVSHAIWSIATSIDG